jgi:hypothetical protein
MEFNFLFDIKGVKESKQFQLLSFLHFMLNVYSGCAFEVLWVVILV